MSLPSRTAAIIPQPQEQKLHEVVNSLMFESFRFCVAARIAETSRIPSSASPAPPARVSRSRSRRLTVVGRRASFPALRDSSTVSSMSLRTRRVRIWLEHLLCAELGKNVPDQEHGSRCEKRRPDKHEEREQIRRCLDEQSEREDHCEGGQQHGEPKAEHLSRGVFRCLAHFIACVGAAACTSSLCAGPWQSRHESVPVR